MPTTTELLNAGKDIQSTFAELCNKTSQTIAAIHVQDKVRLKEISKTLYHLYFDFCDLADALQEISGIPINVDMKRNHHYEEADSVDWRQNLLLIYKTASDLQKELRVLCTKLEGYGVTLTLTRRFNGRLFLDLAFLTNDLRDADIIS